MVGSLRFVQIHDDGRLHLKLRRRPRNDCEIARSTIEAANRGGSAAKGQNMSVVQLNDVGQENTLPRGELLAASAVAQFYTFARRCMDWANTTRSLQERAVYSQMALQWLAAGARLQTFAQLKKSRPSQRGPPKEARAEIATS